MKMITRVATAAAAAALAMAMLTGCSIGSTTYQKLVTDRYVSAVQAAVAESTVSKGAKQTRTAAKAAADMLDRHVFFDHYASNCEEVDEDMTAGVKTVTKIMCEATYHVDEDGDEGENCTSFYYYEIGGGVQWLQTQQAAKMISTFSTETQKVVGYGVASVDVNGEIYTAVAVEVEETDVD